jgi:hypothetical protein
MFFPVQNLYLASLFKKINIVLKMLFPKKKAIEHTQEHPALL